MRPAAIVLNYSVKDIRNDVCQIIYIYIWRIAIEQTSVGLAHGHPNKHNDSEGSLTFQGGRGGAI